MQLMEKGFCYPRFNKPFHIGDDHRAIAVYAMTGEWIDDGHRHLGITKLEDKCKWNESFGICRI